MAVLVAASATPEGQAAMRAALHEAELRATDLMYMNLGDTPIDVVPPQGITVTELPRDAELHPADALLDAATAQKVTLIVVGTRRRSPVGKLILGSTVQQILLEAAVPVLSVKADFEVS